MCDSKNGGTRAVPANTFSAVVGSTKGPTLEIKARRLWSYSGAISAKDVWTPKECPMEVPAKFTKLLLGMAKFCRAA